MTDLAKWEPCQTPPSEVMEGHYVRLEPLSADKHGHDLYVMSKANDAEDRFRWLPEYPPSDRVEFGEWLAMAEASKDPQYFAVIDKQTGKAVGRQTFMRQDPKNGVIEIGNILWGGQMARSAKSTEAYFLFADLALCELGYRRFEWKCNNKNEPSKKAAERFGMTFEGMFRQATIVKGENRDTAWFSLLDHEWPQMRAAFIAWLSPDNFDAEGNQIKKLQDLKPNA